MVIWIVIAAVLLGLLILVVVTLPLLRRLGTLRRATVKLERLQAEAMALQPGVAQMEQTAQAVFLHETMLQGLALIKASLEGREARPAGPSMTRVSVRRSRPVVLKLARLRQTHRKLASSQGENPTYDGPAQTWI